MTILLGEESDEFRHPVNAGTWTSLVHLSQVEKRFFKKVAASQRNRPPAHSLISLPYSVTLLPDGRRGLIAAGGLLRDDSIPGHARK
jgi:hypothetical protein